MESRISYWKFAVVLIAIVAVAASGYFIWDRYFSEAGLMRRQAALYEKAEKEYIAAMTADTYGGKTPQETLDMFVAALRAGDVELASKYFLLDENASREKWVGYLQGVKERNLLGEMANDIEKFAKPLGSSYENSFAFGLFGEDDTVAVSIRLRLNKYSGVWKIESI